MDDNSTVRGISRRSVNSIGTNWERFQRVMSSVPWSNQRTHEVISEKLLSKEFHCKTKDHKLDGVRRLLSLQSYFLPSILVSMKDK